MLHIYDHNKGVGNRPTRRTLDGSCIPKQVTVTVETKHRQIMNVASTWHRSAGDWDCPEPFAEYPPQLGTIFLSPFIVCENVLVKEEKMVLVG